MAETTKKPVAKKTVAKKTTTHKAPAKKTTAHHKPAAEHKVVHHKEEAPVVEKTEAVAITFEKPTLAKGKYIYATGRRKTAVANVRLFAGSEDSMVNKKKIEVYFSQSAMKNAALHPLALTGLSNDFYILASVNGGGSNAQSEAVRHGVAQALASMSEDMRTLLKKNGFLTRDDRKKERKKPGLRRARRAPQWAKR